VTTYVNARLGSHRDSYKEARDGAVRRDADLGLLRTLINRKGNVTGSSVDSTKTSVKPGKREGMIVTINQSEPTTEALVIIVR
jgi:hypothetical protein